MAGMPADGEALRAQSGSDSDQEEGHLEQAEGPLQARGESNLNSFKVPSFLSILFIYFTSFS
jgi:hypothetical protein